MSNIAIIADNADHHPEWFNVYNQIQVKKYIKLISGAISDSRC